MSRSFRASSTSASTTSSPQTVMTSWPPSSSSSSIVETHVQKHELSIALETKTGPSVLMPRFTMASTSWRIMVGLGACLDCIATLAVLYNHNDNDSNNDNHQNIIQQQLQQPRNHALSKLRRFWFPSKTQLMVLSEINNNNNNNKNDWIPPPVISFFAKWATHFGIFFALLCFLDAFYKAQWKRDEKLIELDRKRVLRQQEQRRADGEDDTTDPQVKVGAWGTYYRTIGMQVLLLPVGFFVVVWQILIQVCHYDSNNTLQSLNATEQAHTISSENFYTTYSTHSLLYALFHFHLKMTNQMITDELLVRRKQLTRRLLLVAIRRPLRSMNRFRLVLQSIRLLQYMAPLMGYCLKIKHNLLDLWKTLQQYLHVMQACRNRKKRWSMMEHTMKQSVAAIRIQSTFRGVRTRKGVKAYMSLLQARKSLVAVRRMQRVIVTPPPTKQRSFTNNKNNNNNDTVVRGKTHLDLMRLELEKLKEEAKTARKSGILLNVDYRRRMYELEDELKQAADELVNKHLLLRPNAKFTVLWKIIFVCFAIMDISHQALKPVIHRYSNHILDTTTKKLPKCISVRPYASRFSNPNRSRRPRFLWRIMSKKKKKKQESWYCREPFLTAHFVGISVLRFMLTKSLLVTIGIVCYLDVVITFFIGEWNPGNGVLSPKPWFPRWIFPGLLLELFANPQMESTSKYIVQIVDGLLYIGPSRAWRWILVFFYPLSKLLLKALAVHVWYPVVERENHDVFREDQVVQLVVPPPRHSILKRIPSALKDAEGRSCYANRYM